VAAAKSGVHVVGDMPWLSYHLDVSSAVANAARLVRAGADSVKLEGGASRVPVVRALVDAQIPVVGHLGLTPQSVMAMGGYKVQAKTKDAAARLLEEAMALEEAGVFALVIEGVPSSVGDQVTEALSVPTIGIGAGSGTDGQVLVFHDLLGMSRGQAPKFVRRYAEIGQAMTAALAEYARDVRSGNFPSEAESYPNPAAQ
jgi:3-methyl-2-oxobutanoate hydroxymethyltransferase